MSGQEAAGRQILKANSTGTVETVSGTGLFYFLLVGLFFSGETTFHLLSFPSIILDYVFSGTLLYL